MLGVFYLLPVPEIIVPKKSVFAFFNIFMSITQAPDF